MHPIGKELRLAALVELHERGLTLDPCANQTRVARVQRLQPRDAGGPEGLARLGGLGHNLNASHRQGRHQRRAGLARVDEGAERIVDQPAGGAVGGPIAILGADQFPPGAALP